MARSVDQLVAAFEDGSEITMWDVVRDEPDVAWEAIRALYPRLTDRQIAAVAAGPVEDLLKHHGPAFIDRVEREARVYAAFRHVLGGVWPSSIDERVWERVVRIPGTAW